MYFEAGWIWAGGGALYCALFKSVFTMDYVVKEMWHCGARIRVKKLEGLLIALVEKRLRGQGTVAYF